ncbi:SHOCT domain-containing protein [Halapricum hydrolyticum]|uniref:SHOCT domain-containing protein n=1 Tax=Halapricum hydrolyticum TaxID=2979991 RepID=A0AAE3LGT6_9EURY|nr:SHOCT domain-containing protein [Halapricum hydrolyticum]MCU4717102.1 SHOCT domain-containing protein [Halapricum hydrolyticum]MCU4726029.1 SHOCT domain-containing protein [Halapricum hydrolyticum]
MSLTELALRSRTGRAIGAVAGTVAVLAALTMPAAAQHGGGAMGGGVGGVGWFGLGPLLWIVVIGAIVALVTGYARPNNSTEADPRSGTDGALAALRERYARGELSDEEFERRRQRLQRDQL